MAVGVHYSRAGDFIEWIRERDDIHNSLDEDTLKEEDVVAEVDDGKMHISAFPSSVLSPHLERVLSGPVSAV